MRLVFLFVCLPWLFICGTVAFSCPGEEEILLGKQGHPKCAFLLWKL